MSEENLFIKIYNFLIRFLACFIFSRTKRRNFRQKYLLNNKNKLAYASENKHFTVYKEEITCGKNTYIGGDAKIYHSDTVVGAYTSISWHVAIGTSQHPINWLSTSPFQYFVKPDNLCSIKVSDKNKKTFEWRKPITVGNDVWIGCNVTVMDGVSIGDGAIVGAGAVVTKDVPPYAIVVGVPAKILRYRFEKETIDELLKLQWWNLDEEFVATLPFNDISSCIEQIKKYKNEIK